MKVTKWWKKLSVAIAAAGIWLPSTAFAVNIPLGDPSFEDYMVPAGVSTGYAYADAYRPTSAWIDDLDSPPGYTQDDAASNWLYSAAYADYGGSSGAHKRAVPRTGDQAMHGFFHYSGQETSAVFEANTTYTFSVWAQGDIDATGSSSRVWMYMFDGSVPFSEANSLTFARYAPDTLDFVNRSPAWSPAESQANWTQISLSYSVLAGAPEIGHPVGVAMWIGDDGAVDDASLSSNPTVPEPTTVILVGMGGLSLLACRRRR
jgi:PEP-CTERM motif